MNKHTNIILATTLLFTLSSCMRDVAINQNYRSFSIVETELRKTHNFNKSLVHYYFNAKQAQIDAITYQRTDSSFRRQQLNLSDPGPQYYRREIFYEKNNQLLLAYIQNLNQADYLKSYLNKIKIKVDRVLDDNYEVSLRILEEKLSNVYGEKKVIPFDRQRANDDRYNDDRYRNIYYDEYTNTASDLPIDLDRLNRVIDRYLISLEPGNFINYEFENEIDQILEMH